MQFAQRSDEELLLEAQTEEAMERFRQGLPPSAEQYARSRATEAQRKAASARHEEELRALQAEWDREEEFLRQTEVENRAWRWGNDQVERHGHQSYES